MTPPPAVSLTHTLTHSQVRASFTAGSTTTATPPPQPLTRTAQQMPPHSSHSSLPTHAHTPEMPRFSRFLAFRSEFWALTTTHSFPWRMRQCSHSHTLTLTSPVQFHSEINMMCRSPASDAHTSHSPRARALVSTRTKTLAHSEHSPSLTCFPRSYSLSKAHEGSLTHKDSQHTETHTSRTTLSVVGSFGNEELYCSCALRFAWCRGLSFQ